MKMRAFHKNSFSYIEACLDLCVEVETNFFGGPMYSAVGKARMLSPELRKVEWDRAVKNLRIVCDMAAEEVCKLRLNH